MKKKNAECSRNRHPLAMPKGIHKKGALPTPDIEAFKEMGTSSFWSKSCEKRNLNPVAIHIEDPASEITQEFKQIYLDSIDFLEDEASISGLTK